MKAALPMRDSQHTTLYGVQMFCLSKGAARRPKGRGQLSFPFGHLVRERADISHAFVTTFIQATVSSAGCAGANRRRPEPVFEGECSSWTACATVLSACRACSVLPRALKATVLRQSTGALTEGRLALRSAFGQWLHALDGGGSHRLAGLS